MVGRIVHTRRSCAELPIIVHQGPARTPFIESAGRTNIEPNFYYPQEDLLFQYCRDHPSTSWNVICPAWVSTNGGRHRLRASLPHHKSSSHYHVLSEYS